MTIEAQLADGRILEFPDGTDQSVIQATVKRTLGAPTTRPDATAGERTQAAVGGVNRGIAGLVGLPVDTAENILNLGIAGVGSVANVAGRPDLAPDLIKGSLGGSEWLVGLLNRGGINTSNPRPDDLASRALHTGGMIAASGGRRPIAPAVGGVIAQETLGPEYTGVGAMTPAAGAQAYQAGRQAVANRVAPNVQTFKDAGTAPTVGQATESNFIRGLENLAAKFPGGVGVMRTFADKQQLEMSSKTRTGVSAEDAGRAIERGITGTGGFVDRFKKGQDALYNQLDAHIQTHTPINVVNTTRALTTINEGVPGAPNLSQFFINSKMKGIEGALADDLKQASVTGALPYEAIKKLRTLVGRELADATIASDVPKSKWKALYGALSEDLGAAARAQGPKAEQTWKRANDYTRAGLDRIESVLERTIGKTPEETFSRVMPRDADQSNKVRSVMRSLTPSERDVVSEAVVNRLGRATPGKQNEAGDVFSSETFLTNWNKISPGAKAQFFQDATVRRNLDAIAKSSNNLREGSKTFANPSGTAGAAAPYGLGAMAATGNVAAAAGMIGGTYLGAKMLTNPKVVEWLAKVPDTRPEGMASHLARLGVIYNSADDGLKAELDKYMAGVQASK